MAKDSRTSQQNGFKPTALK